MGRFVDGEVRRRSLLLPPSLDNYVTEDKPVRVVAAWACHVNSPRLDDPLLCWNLGAGRL
jgi:hypothetical protein